MLKNPIAEGAINQKVGWPTRFRSPSAFLSPSLVTSARRSAATDAIQMGWSRKDNAWPFPMPLGLSPLGQQVFRACQRYGAFVIDVAGGVTNLRAQANAYDQVTIAALQRDLPMITPMLERVD